MNDEPEEPPAPMQWFGESWGSACCKPERHVKQPPRERCAFCRQAFEANAQGVSLLGYTTTDPPGWMLEAYHLTCFVGFVGFISYPGLELIPVRARVHSYAQCFVMQWAGVHCAPCSECDAAAVRVVGS